ncbi:hypothetical protein KAK06_13345 [Ideonella sp. 4Y11]|uniref:DUF1963 domain-containing protein n=1 Tax=Ideonella aquatica TaxID=2824119 RepID=A0A940YN37_9BURK|nr:hypothetical protein [Ideonella aquatica]MBQ0959932.1 hypothetical protein [Ideonella aquatica]
MNRRASEAFPDVQSVLLRRPAGAEVRHVVLQVPAGRAHDAARLLRSQPISHGARPQGDMTCSIGFSCAGLEALKVPDEYLRVFRSLAPSFAAGAPARRAAVGDGIANQQPPQEDWPDLSLDRAHVLVTLHGPAHLVETTACSLRDAWLALKTTPASAPPFVALIRGAHLPPPSGQEGRWAHFGLRDDLSDIAIEPLADIPAAQQALDHRQHAPGALLLGHPDDMRINRWALPRAPSAVREFFRNASFGAFRPAVQDVVAFEQAVTRWADELLVLLGKDEPLATARQLIKAKLSGRWPDGRRIEPGTIAPSCPSRGSFCSKQDCESRADCWKKRDAYALQLLRPKASSTTPALYEEADSLGQGCPFGSHVRRLQSRPDADGAWRPRPLLRRSVPFGPACWEQLPTDGIERGQLGHFFCADLQSQFEELLGQWVAASPPGRDLDDRALDPLIGPHDDPSARLLLPMAGWRDVWLEGFKVFVRPRGLMYAWYPSAGALTTLLTNDFVRAEDRGPWL